MSQPWMTPLRVSSAPNFVAPGCGPGAFHPADRNLAPWRRGSWPWPLAEVGTEWFGT